MSVGRSDGRVFDVEVEVVWMGSAGERAALVACGGGWRVTVVVAVAVVVAYIVVVIVTGSGASVARSDSAEYWAKAWSFASSLADVAR